MGGGKAGSTTPKDPVGGSNLIDYSKTLAGIVRQPTENELQYQRQYDNYFKELPSFRDMASANAHRNIAGMSPQLGNYTILPVGVKPITTDRITPTYEQFNPTQPTIEKKDKEGNFKNYGIQERKNSNHR